MFMLFSILHLKQLSDLEFFLKDFQFHLIPNVKRFLWSNPKNDKQQPNHWQTTSVDKYH